MVDFPYSVPTVTSKSRAGVRGVLQPIRDVIQVGINTSSAAVGIGVDMAVPSEDGLTDAIAHATRWAVADLFREHPEDFYYCSLITTGEAHPPVLAAWSREALDAAVAGAADPDGARLGLKWSYADSPYLCYGDAHFGEVRRLFGLRPQIGADMTDEAWAAEYDLRLRAMERALARLDAEGAFGTGAARLRLVINAEVMPPDYTNTERALRLNPAGALQEWLAECAEPI
jgi:hypothetical protein